jgi:hypothetical protein
MAKAGLIEEMMNDALDSALDNEEIEEETDAEVEKVRGGGGHQLQSGVAFGSQQKQWRKNVERTKLQRVCCTGRGGVVRSVWVKTWMWAVEGEDLAAPGRRSSAEQPTLAAAVGREPCWFQRF